MGWHSRPETCPAGRSASYRIFPRGFARAHRGRRGRGAATSKSEPDSLELSRRRAQAGTSARLRIRLDLFELLQHQRDGYLPSVAELQGRYLDLVIFKNELSATPYQEVVLTTDGQDAHRIRREPDGRLVMTPLAAREDGDDR